MIRKIRHIILLCSTVFFFSATSAFAVIPLIAWAGSVMLHTAVVGGLTWLAYKSGNQAASVAGDIAMRAQAVWIDLADVNAPVQQTRDVSITKTYAQVQEAVASNPSRFPTLNSAIKGSPIPEVANPPYYDTSFASWVNPASLVAGAKIRDESSVSGGNEGGNIYQLESITWSNPTTTVFNSSGHQPWSGTYYTVSGGVFHAKTQTDTIVVSDISRVVSTATGVLVPSQSSGADFTNYIGTNVSPAATAELNDLIKSTGGINTASVRDTATPASAFGAPTWSQPVAPTLEQILSAGGVPSGDHSTIQSDTSPDDNPVGVPTADARKTLDWTKFHQLKSSLSNTYPFSILGNLANKFSVFVDSPAPVFSLALPFGNALSVDLAIFDPLAVVIRWLIGLSMTIGILYAIVRFYRGVA